MLLSLLSQAIRWRRLPPQLSDWLSELREEVHEGASEDRRDNLGEHLDVTARLTITSLHLTSCSLASLELDLDICFDFVPMLPLTILESPSHTEFTSIGYGTSHQRTAFSSLSSHMDGMGCRMSRKKIHVFVHIPGQGPRPYHALIDLENEQPSPSCDYKSHLAVPDQHRPGLG